jgi:regulator of sigma E protease
VKAAEGAPWQVTLWRAGEELDVTLSPRRVDLPVADGFDTRWLIGIGGQLFFDEMKESVGPIEAAQIGVDRLWYAMSTSISAVKHIIIGEISTCNLSGPVGIAETSGSMARQGTVSFIWFIGALSAAVGLINLFPIPVLDGGHLMFYAYEAVLRRKPSDRAVQVFMFVGLALILSLMSFTVLNDTVLCP